MSAVRFKAEPPLAPAEISVDSASGRLLGHDGVSLREGAWKDEVGGLPLSIGQLGPADRSIFQRWTGSSWTDAPGDLGNFVVGKSLAQRQTITCVADVGGSLNGAYFILKDEAGAVAFWFDHGDGGAPEPLHGADRSVEITTVADNDIADDVALKVSAAIDADVFSTSLPVGRSFVVTND